MYTVIMIGMVSDIKHDGVSIGNLSGLEIKEIGVYELHIYSKSTREEASVPIVKCV